MKNHLDKKTSFSSDISRIVPKWLFVFVVTKSVSDYCCSLSLPLSRSLGISISNIQVFENIMGKCKTPFSPVTHCELTSNSHFNSPTISLELIHKSQFWHLKCLSVPYSLVLILHSMHSVQQFVFSSILGPQNTHKQTNIRKKKNIMIRPLNQILLTPMRIIIVNVYNKTNGRKGFFCCSTLHLIWIFSQITESKIQLVLAHARTHINPSTSTLPKNKQRGIKNGMAILFRALMRSNILIFYSNRKLLH